MEEKQIGLDESPVCGEHTTTRTVRYKQRY